MPLEGWKANRSSGPIDRPGTIRIELSAGALDGDPTKERFAAMVITSLPEDPTSEDERLEKGLTRLIELLQDKLTALQSGNTD
jgi:hypothetical protein